MAIQLIYLKASKSIYIINKSMKLKFILILLIVSLCNTYAQNDTIYYNTKWEVTTKDFAAFYRPKPKKINNLWLVKDYYINGNLQFRGTLKNLEKEFYDGDATWYLNNGRVQEKIRYKNGEIIGYFTALESSETNVDYKKDGYEERNLYFVAYNSNIAKPKNATLYNFSKNCDSTFFKFELDTQHLIITKNSKISSTYSIPASELVSEVLNTEQVNDFSITCTCISPNNIRLHYSFSLAFNKLKTVSHYISFNKNDALIKRAFYLFEDKNEETIVGEKFLPETSYSYNHLEKLYSKFTTIASFNGFQNKNNKHSITDFYNSIKSLHTNGNYDELILKADIIVLNQYVKNIPITDALVKYNNIAYYLEQSKLYKQAIFLLEKIITEFPNRTVAYINLGDAYWGLNKKSKANDAYKTYVAQMKVLNKESKIPKQVLNRLIQ